MSARATKDFETYMKRQINEIRAFKNTLEKALGREIESDMAARAWIKEYAPQFRHNFEDQKRAKTSAQQ